MKTAGRENPNRRATVPDDRAHGATGQEQILLNQVGCEARKIAAGGEIFFLTSTFIELPGVDCFAGGPTSGLFAFDRGTRWLSGIGREINFRAGLNELRLAGTLEKAESRATFPGLWPA